MAYTVLARRYRSQTFDDVVGQNHVAQTLKKAIASDRIAHAFLFTGTRGTGKTSMARILAKALNCHDADKPTPSPCLKCESCTAVARGEDMDVIEIDAASNTQVDKTREVILDNAQYRPARSRFKVYIIDEVHMLSKASFNALLKTIEEPPEHVKFILATTEVEKVLPTILSRCQRYDFRNIPTKEIAAHLRKICKDEGIKADDEALLLVAKAGAGSMRDSLSLLDRLLSIGEKKLTVETIEQLLGLPRAQALFDLTQAIGEGRVKDVLSQADTLITQGLAADTLISSLTDHLRNLLVLRTCGADSDLVEVAGLSTADLAAQASRFDPVTLTQDITILEDLRRHLRQSSAGRALLDATLVRLALADQFTSIADLLGATDSRAAAPAPAQKKKPEELASPTPPVALVGSASADRLLSPPALNNRPAEADPSPVAISDLKSEIQNPNPLPINLDLDDPSTDTDDDLPRPGKVWEGPSLKELLQKPASKPSTPEPPPGEPSNVQTADPNDLSTLWRSLLSALQEKPGLQAFISHGQLAAVDDHQAVIRYPSERATSYNMMTRNGKKELVADAFSRILNRSIGVRFELEAEPAGAIPSTAAALQHSASGTPPPPANGARPRFTPSPDPLPPPQPAPTRITPEQAAELEKNPLISALLRDFSATMLKISDEPA